MRSRPRGRARFWLDNGSAPKYQNKSMKIESVTKGIAAYPLASGLAFT
jgi:hypothetical protein